VSSQAELPVNTFRSFDGAELVWRETGEGRPAVLLHGFFSDARTNWIRYGHAAAIAAKGFRVIMPDLRAHGSSDRPHDTAAYPPDVLADDGFALIAHLGLADYDLGGYSLGGRTTVRMLARGARPGKAIVSGMGLIGLTNTGARSAHFKHILDNLGSFEKFTPEWNAEAFLKTTKGDPVALRLLLDSFVDTAEADIAGIAMPVLVLSGSEDQDNGSAAALADLLPQGQLVETPGGHMSAVTRPEMGQAMADFLAA
jgi:pimeloyl-ACP methyl ester carboxylesterase